jgi:AraC-like DNA-binding protein
MSCGSGRRGNPQYHRHWGYRSLDKARLGSRLRAINISLPDIEKTGSADPNRRALPQIGYPATDRIRTLLGRPVPAALAALALAARVHMSSYLLQQKFGRRVGGVGLL